MSFCGIRKKTDLINELWFVAGQKKAWRAGTISKHSAILPPTVKKRRIPTSKVNFISSV